MRPPAERRAPASPAQARPAQARPVGTGNVLGRGGGQRVSTGLTARMAEREAAARRLRLVRAAVAAGVLAVLAAVAWVLLASPVLALEEVEVTLTGTTVDEATVRAVVEPELGTPLLRVSTSAITARLRDIPQVEKAQVVRSWPRGVAVSVVAREPVAAVAQGEGWVLLDADGVQVAAGGAVPEGLPQVTVPLDAADETAPALRAVLAVLAALPEDVLGQVATAGASGTAQVTLTLDDGATVRWGSAQESELKTQVLRVLRQQTAGVYDVSVPRSPTTS
ncbi:FtsQ-type POTRA domain-containing protein [Georgenia yuyongxinii]|uniref:FtsQ-type POTRA domain-containing protein n=1 Tax=Georgenia yuyongxinii TaxID=2589797 RepID=A0A5B8C2H8_9MICO|nr:FtsQ-type POTRA domain-containing protein [Georgenia yuyongxinii]